MPRKDWLNKVGRGSPRGSLKFEKKKRMVTTRSGGMWSREGGKEGRKKKKTSEVVGYSRYRSGEENPCR
jgi:hypothetical protein